MGVSDSIHCQQPQFKNQQWQLIENDAQSPAEYGYYRTFRHIKTGRKIDQYLIVCESQAHFELYLQSLNWRYQQTNIVDAPFANINNESQLCGRSYSLRIYIDHMKTRLCQIGDIPFPDNLYILMEALEGYSLIFNHSGYFRVEENQICVDEHGNVKIWINSNLSYNYPKDQNALPGEGQQTMVRQLIQIIDQNTDRQTEPQPSFKTYHAQSTERVCTFEETRVMVLAYARMMDVQIPQRFQAVMNIDDLDQPQQVDHLNFQQMSRQSPALSNQYQPSTQPLINSNREYYPSYVHHQQKYEPIPHYERIQLRHQIPINNHIHLKQFHHIPQYQPAYHHNQPIWRNQPVYQQPIFIASPHLQLNNDQSTPHLLPIQSNQQLSHQQQPFMRHSRKNQTEQLQNHPFIVETVPIEGPERQYVSSSSHSKKRQLSQSLQNYQIHDSRSKKNSGHNGSLSEADDKVAKSLPIKSGYPSNNPQLSINNEQKRAAYSHINTQQWQLNPDNFGLTAKQQTSSINLTLKKQANKMKCFYSLDQQFELDADIAADMIKYLS